MKRSAPIIWLFVASAAMPATYADSGPDARPVGLILAAQRAVILTPFANSAIPAAAGTALFAGDRVRNVEGALTLLHCASGDAESLAPGAVVRVGPGSFQTEQGTVESQSKPGPCELPIVNRRGLASGAPLPEGTAARALTEEVPAASPSPAVDPVGIAAQLNAAAALERRGQFDEAQQVFASLGSRLPGAVWTRGVISRLELERSRKNSPLHTGTTSALLIGISQYESVSSLQYADHDAETFATLLKSPRGGGLKDSDILLLTNANATRAKIDDAVNTFVKERVSPENTLILFVAAHGALVVTKRDPVTKNVQERAPYILTYESKTDDPKTSGYPMAEFRRLIAQQALKFRRVLVYVDVCHAGNIAAIAGSTELEPEVREVFQGDKSEVGVLLASDRKNVAYESELIGDGHGAFTYYVLDGLNGSALPQGEDRLRFADLMEHVHRNVYDITNGAQRTDRFATDEDMVIADELKEKPGIQLAPAHKLPPGQSRLRSAAKPPEDFSIAPAISQVPDADGDGSGFEAALAAGRLLPRDPNSAWAFLERLQANPRQPADANRDRARRLRIALEELGQRVILKYLEGDQVPQQRTDFDTGAGAFRYALRLSPGIAFDESRMDFCLARALIFEHRYQDAEKLLGLAILLDPERGYAYNALGIAYLEQIPNDPSNYQRASAAFQDAIRYAPYWAYPLHNLALTHAERGEYSEAVAAYREAMRLAPNYTYLPYNLGLLEQRLNRTEDAVASYRVAMRIAEANQAVSPHRPWLERATIYNALGTMAAAQGHQTAAEKQFRLALTDDPDLLDARHNLALALSVKRASAEAKMLWRSVLAADPAHLPARLAFGEYLLREGRFADAAEQYRLLLETRPDFTGARADYAKALASSGRKTDALAQLQLVDKASPNDPSILEKIGDLQLSLNQPSEAKARYEDAAAAAQDSKTRRRIKRKLAQIAA